MFLRWVCDSASAEHGEGARKRGSVIKRARKREGGGRASRCVIFINGAKGVITPDGGLASLS